MKLIILLFSVFTVTLGSIRGCEDHRFCRYHGQNICNLEHIRLKWCPKKCGASCATNSTSAELVSVSCKGSNLSADGKDLEKFQKATSDFAWSLYRQVRETAQGENMIFSPASISLAMGMAMSGASADTRTQMRRVLTGELPDDKVRYIRTVSLFLINKFLNDRQTSSTCSPKAENAQGSHEQVSVGFGSFVVDPRVELV